MSGSSIEIETLMDPPTLSSDSLCEHEDGPFRYTSEFLASTSSELTTADKSGEMTETRAPSSLSWGCSVRDDSRLHNTLSFIVPSEYERPSVGEGTGLENMSTHEQERLLMRELLTVLKGVQSDLIQVTHSSFNEELTFVVDARIEPRLKELTLKMAEMGLHYSAVARFRESWSGFSKGQVGQALAAACHPILKDYFILLSQMESLYMRGELSLQKVLFYVHPTQQIMKLLSSIVSGVEKFEKKDGCVDSAKVLSLLHERAVSMVGDPVGQSVCFTLAEKASTPYFAILEEWMYRGRIYDPFEEFIVRLAEEEEEEVRPPLHSRHHEGERGHYWEQKYVVVPDKCPSFLKNLTSEILKAGKYLNVIRQCGKDVTWSVSKITYSTHERVYEGAIHKAHAFASKTLLELLLNEYDLLKRLISVKHYLLMDQGDFIVQFLDLTETELNKPIDDINPVRLESLLELALRTSSSSTDIYKDSVKVHLFPLGIGEQLQQIITVNSKLQIAIPDLDELNFKIPGFKGFSFSYEVKWPISLILDYRAITCYQMIFRHLFFCKHVERQLCKVWVAKKSLKKSDLMEDIEKASIFSLHQRMLNFVQNLQYYMAFEVVEPAWHSFIETLNKVTNIDQVLDCHWGMISSILEDTMLTKPILLEKMTGLLSICLQFAGKIVTPDDPDESENPELPDFGCMLTVDEIAESFHKELVNFLKAVAREVQDPTPNQPNSSRLPNIIYRVNFNGFYTNPLEE